MSVFLGESLCARQSGRIAGERLANARQKEEDESASFSSSAGHGEPDAATDDRVDESVGIEEETESGVSLTEADDGEDLPAFSWSSIVREKRTKAMAVAPMARKVTPMACAGVSSPPACNAPPDAPRW